MFLWERIIRFEKCDLKIFQIRDSVFEGNAARGAVGAGGGIGSLTQSLVACDNVTLVNNTGIGAGGCYFAGTMVQCTTAIGGNYSAHPEFSLEYFLDCDCYSSFSFHFFVWPVVFVQQNSGGVLAQGGGVVLHRSQVIGNIVTCDSTFKCLGRGAGIAVTTSDSSFQVLLDS